MRAFVVAIIVFGFTLVISILVVFSYGMSDNQTLPPSTAARKTFTIGTLIALAIVASHWLRPYGPETLPLAMGVETPQQPHGGDSRPQRISIQDSGRVCRQTGSRRFPQNTYKGGRLPTNERQLDHRCPENGKPHPDVRSG